MKNQYFGDKRDLFKYDLLLDVIEAFQPPLALTFIPMLTSNDPTAEGSLTNYPPNSRRQDLVKFLQGCLAAKQRDLVLLRGFFRAYGITYQPYKDDEFFTDEGRTPYFSNIPTAWLKSAVVFFDPDVGLETSLRSYMERNGIDKYLMYDNVRTVWDKAAEDSILLLYQHLQNNKNKIELDLSTRARCLSDILSPPRVEWVHDRDVAFLAIAKSQDITSRTLEVLKRHASRHRIFFGAT